MALRVVVQQEPFDFGAEAEGFAAGRHDLGAVVTFTGVVRDVAGTLEGQDASGDAAFQAELGAFGVLVSAAGAVHIATLQEAGYRTTPASTRRSISADGSPRISPST